MFSSPRKRATRSPFGRAAACIFLLAGLPQGALAASLPTVAESLSWTDLADLALASPVVLSAVVSRVDRVGRRDAPDVPQGHVRALVRADLSAALKAPALLPASAAWFWQGPAGQRGRPPFAKSAPVLVFAAPLAGGGDPETQPMRLTTAHGQQPWSAGAEAAVRDILSQALQPGADGLMVTGVNDGFRTIGAIPGMSESQFFLATQGGRPLTMVVRRAPAAEPVIAVATGDLVDRAAPVQPRTLVWRGLACGLPDRLPVRLADNADLSEDYALARQSIGPCGRTVEPPR